MPMLLRRAIAFFLLPALGFGLSAAHGATVEALIGDPVHAKSGEHVGAIDDLIIDVRAGRVLYVIVDAKDRYYTLPIRALDERQRLDMDLANAVARQPAEDDAKFRRAARLLGQPVQNPGGGQVGRIADIQFDVVSGEVEQVVLQTGRERIGLPASVLANTRFPPLTRWQVEHPGPRTEDRQGFVRRGASDERQRLHNPEWERR